MEKRALDQRGDDPRHLVAQAERQLAAVGVAIDEAILALEAGEGVSGAEIKAQVMALRKALEAVFTERARMQAMEEEAGHVAGAFDLRAAWEEIERRFDRLRDARGESGVSGGVE